MIEREDVIANGDKFYLMFKVLELKPLSEVTGAHCYRAKARDCLLSEFSVIE